MIPKWNPNQKKRGGAPDQEARRCRAGQNKDFRLDGLPVVPAEASKCVLCVVVAVEIRIDGA